jgi:hypothetical protein
VRIYDEPWAPVPERRSHPRSRAAVAAVASLAVLAFIVAGGFLTVRFVAEASLGQCAPDWLTGTDPQLCLNASVSGGTLTVSGTTGLPDGAIITVSAESNGTGFNQYWSTSSPAVVSGGEFRRTFDVSTWGPGTILVTAEFVITPDQPQAAIDRYGWAGEGLRGPDVRPDFDRGRPAPMEVRSTVQVDLSAR